MTRLPLRAAATQFVVVLAAVCALGGCSIEKLLNVDLCDSSNEAVTSIDLSTPASLKVQQQANVSGWASSAKGLMLCPPTPTWSSSDPSIATVVPAVDLPQAGTVTGIAVGSVYIRATYKTKTDSVRVNVVP